MQTRTARASNRVAFVIAIAMWSHPLRGECQEIDVKELVETHIVPALRAARHQEQVQPVVAGDVRSKTLIESTSWSLILGEVLSKTRSDLSLWSGASEALDDAVKGLDELEEIEKEAIKSATDDDPVLMMKLDASRAKRREVEATLELTREKEWNRVNDLRQLAYYYRELVDEVADIGFHDRLGRHDLTEANLVAAIRASDRIEQLISTSRDYYLFEDEVRRPREDDESKYDFKFLTAPPEGFRTSFKSHLKSLRCLALYRLGNTASNAGKTSTARDLFKESLRIAQEIIDAEAEDLPTEQRNFLARIAAGWSSLSLAVSVRAERPFVADNEATQQVANAIEFLSIARDGLAKDRAGSEALTDLMAGIDAMLDKLNAADWFSDRSRALTGQGDVASAYATLRQAALVHQTSDICIAYLESGLRAGIPVDQLSAEFQSAAKSGVINARQPNSVLMSSRLLAARVWGEMSTSGLDALRRDKTLIRQIDSQLSANRRSLMGSTVKPSSLLSARIQAVTVFLYDLRRTVMKEADPRRAVGFTEMVRHIQDSQQVLNRATSKLEEQTNTAREKGNADEFVMAQAALVPLRESRAELYLASAHLAASTLEEFHDDAMIGYMAAYDELAALPYATNYLKSVGSPLLEGIELLRSRSPQDQRMLALEERSRRKTFEGYLEGMFLLYLGNPKEAAAVIARSRPIERAAEDETGRHDARERFLLLEGLSNDVDRETTLTAFSIIAHAEAGNESEAFQRAVAILLREKNPRSWSNAQLREAIDQVESPLIGLAVVRALDSKLKTYSLTDEVERRIALIETASAAAARVTMLGERRPYLKQRFPGLLEVNAQIASRLRGPEPFIRELARVNQNGDAAGAVQIARNGLTYHPMSVLLWRALLDGKIELLRSEGKNDRESTRSIVSLIQAAEKSELISLRWSHFYQGAAHEAAQQWDEAISEYQAVESSVSDPRDSISLTIRSQSKLLELSTAKLAASLN